VRLPGHRGQVPGLGLYAVRQCRSESEPRRQGLRLLGCVELAPGLSLGATQQHRAESGTG
jgi:hypothetical protein